MKKHLEQVLSNGITEGLRSFEGYEEVYFRHLKRFLLKYSNSEEKIITMIIDNQYDNAYSYLSDICKLSGVLCVEPVYDCAVTMAEQIDKRKCIDFNLLKRYGRIFKDVQAANISVRTKFYSHGFGKKKNLDKRCII